MKMHLTVCFVNGTTFETVFDKFMVDHMNRCLAIEVGATQEFSDSFIFPLENMKYWKIKRQGVVQ